MGLPVIQSIPDTSFHQGDTLIIYLNDFVNDPDTPDSLLTWEVLKAEDIGYNIAPEENILTLNSSLWTGKTIIILEVTDPNDYSAIDTFNVEVLLPVGLFDLNNKHPLELDFSISPNPFKDNIYIKTYIADTEFTLRLFSVDGKLLAIRESQNAKGIQCFYYELGVNIPPGTYFLNVISGNQFKTKIIIKK